MLEIIKFSTQPTWTHEMEYQGDARKDKFLKGRDGSDFPKIQINDPLKRSGVLKIALVSHKDINSLYHLHLNHFVNKTEEKNKGKKRKAKNTESIEVNDFCDDNGVATYLFENKTGTIEIALKNLCIRHGNKKDYEAIKTKWNKNADKFDPFGVGYGNIKDLDMEYVKICCQVIFDDNKTFATVSDQIFNGPPDIKIEYWDPNREVNVNGNEQLCILVRKLSTDQRDIFARFSDDAGWFDDVDFEHYHHDFGLVFKIPSYENLNNDTEIVCHVQLLVKNKDYYFSEKKSFKYVNDSNHIRNKRRYGEAFIEDEPKFEINRNNNQRFTAKPLSSSKKIRKISTEERPIATTSFSNIENEDLISEYELNDLCLSSKLLNPNQTNESDKSVLEDFDINHSINNNQNSDQNENWVTNSSTGGNQCSQQVDDVSFERQELNQSTLVLENVMIQESTQTISPSSDNADNQVLNPTDIDDNVLLDLIDPYVDPSQFLKDPELE